MRLIDWTAEIPGCQVIYSSLTEPHERDELNKDVAAIRLPDGRGIDVEWNDERQVFWLTLFFESFHNRLSMAETDETWKLLEIAKRWAAERTH